MCVEYVWNGVKCGGMRWNVSLTVVCRGVATETQVLTRRSTSDTSAAVMARGRLKSNLGKR